MRYLVLLVGLFLTATLPGQETAEHNPYELTGRQAVASVADSLSVAAADTSAAVIDTGADGTQVFVHLLLLLTLASLWVLFRDLLQQCLAAAFNDSVMTQLYRRRSGGRTSALLLCYLLFLLAAGLYVYLAATYFGVMFNGGVWIAWLSCVLLVASVLGLKFLVLLLLGRVYGLRKELSRYTFALMVFSILAGLLLVPVNLLVSYAPLPLRPYALWGGMGMLLVVYLLHLLRGLFIANAYVGSRPLHFLLYICTIEIAPLLLVYHYLRDSLLV